MTARERLYGLPDDFAWWELPPQKLAEAIAAEYAAILDQRGEE